MKTSLNFIEDISSVDKSEYGSLLNANDSPFIKHSFLEALEVSGSVSDIKGWRVNHLLSKKDEALDGFLPIYLKNNSHGEFVFDHSWSYALERAGRKYYPKLLSAIPFTPCETRKVITFNQQLPLIEKVLSFEDFHDADEVFASGNMMKVTPVSAFDETNYQVGPITKKAREMYWDWALSEKN